MPNVDDLKGRAKQAVGDASGNDRLRREGKVDRLAGKAKEATEDVREKVEEAVDNVKERIDKR